MRRRCPHLSADFATGSRGRSAERSAELTPRAHVLVVLAAPLLLTSQPRAFRKRSIAFVTPQGRAFAQDVLQFFTRTEDTAFPLQPSQIVTGAPDLSAPTAEPPAPLISIAEAEAQVGFGVAELPFVPDGFNYLGARLYGNAVNIEYATQGYGGHLSIMQSQKGFIQSEWDKVPAHAVVPVKVGELDGEFAQGTFVVYAGETSATWEPDAAILRLRWVKDGVWFAMTKHGDVQVIEYLDQAGMIELAESLAVEP